MQQSCSVRGALFGARGTPFLTSAVFRYPIAATASALCSYGDGEGKKNPRGGAIEAKNKKENVWSVDNNAAARAAAAADRKDSARRLRMARRARAPGGRGRNTRVLVSGAMVMGIETVLQAQEPVIEPEWNTFASSVCGIWKGAGAVFSPFTAEMDPIALGKNNENLYDCYTHSLIEKASLEAVSSEISRKTNWVSFNPLGETKKHSGVDGLKGNSDAVGTSRHLPSFESFDFRTSEVMEEDIMHKEPGLVYFEDGSYSRGLIDIPVGEFDDSKYFLSPTFKFEQCLVKGRHKRLRIVHTIEFIEGGSRIQVWRVALFQEQRSGAINFNGGSDTRFDVEPFSRRIRVRPSDLAGSWKAFEVSAEPVSDERGEGVAASPFVYRSTEAVKKRRLPGKAVCSGDDVVVLWLPGGVTAYVNVEDDGVLRIGAGWYSDEGINLVIERGYGINGKLKEVRWKSEEKRTSCC